MSFQFVETLPTKTVIFSCPLARQRNGQNILLYSTMAIHCKPSQFEIVFKSLVHGNTQFSVKQSFKLFLGIKVNSWR